MRADLAALAMLQITKIDWGWVNWPKLEMPLLFFSEQRLRVESNGIDTGIATGHLPDVALPGILAAVGKTGRVIGLRLTVEVTMRAAQGRLPTNSTEIIGGP